MSAYRTALVLAVLLVVLAAFALVALGSGCGRAASVSFKPPPSPAWIDQGGTVDEEKASDCTEVLGKNDLSILQ